MNSNRHEAVTHIAESTSDVQRANDVASPVAGSGRKAPDAYDTCARICDSLTRTIGSAGTRALFARALAQSRSEHSSLKGVRIGSDSSEILDGVSDAVIAHGETAVNVALETLLGALLMLLGRLIGEDMVTRLIAQIAPRYAPSGEDRDA